jgi:hypothetical protein
MFSAYLNQDFDLLFGAPDDAIRAFVQHSTEDEVTRAIHDVRTILSMKLSEGDLRNLILQDMGSCYYYPAEWESGERWLRHVLHVLGG